MNRATPALAALVALVAGCGDDLGLSGLRFACDADRPCAPGWSCQAGLCVGDGGAVNCFELTMCLTLCATDDDACSEDCLRRAPDAVLTDDYAPMVGCAQEVCPTSEPACLNAAFAADGGCQAEWQNCLAGGIATVTCDEAAGDCKTCGGVVACIVQCNANNSFNSAKRWECVRGCYASATAPVQHDAERLVSCLSEQCQTVTNTACIEAAAAGVCAAEYAACGG